MTYTAGYHFDKGLVRLDRRDLNFLKLEWRTGRRAYDCGASEGFGHFQVGIEANGED